MNRQPDLMGSAQAGKATGQSRVGHSARFLRIVVILVVLALAGGFGFRPAYSQLKRMRALSRIRGLDGPGSTVPLTDAVNRMRMALMVAPNDPDVLRTVARCSTRRGIGGAVDHWARYLSVGQPTDAERLEACGVAIEGGRPDLGRQWLEGLLGRMPEDPRVLSPLFQLAIRAGTGAGAEKVARRRVELLPGDGDARMDLGLLLMVSPNPQAVDEGLLLLAKLACDSGAELDLRQRALSNLRTTMSPQHPLAIQVLEAARGMAGSSIDARLLCWDLEVKSDPARGAACLKDAEQLGQREAAPERRSRIAFWLAGRGATHEALALLPMATCTNDFNTASVRLDCLVVLGRNQEVLETLDACARILPVGCRESMLGSLSIRGGDTNVAEVHFRAALQGAAGACEPRTINYVMQEATRFGLRLVVLEALEAILPLSQEPLQVTRRLSAVLQGVPDLSRVLQSLRVASRVLPEDPSIATERVWHELYLGNSISWCVAEMQKVVKLGAASRDVRMAYAFALLRSGDPAGAQREMDTEVARTEDATWFPRHQVVRVLILGATGQREGARTLARSLRLDGVRTEVRALVEPWL